MSVENIDDLTELLTRPESVDKIIMIDDSQTDLSKRTVKVQADLIRGRTKVLWTGPLSVVSTPTSLDGGEKFSDWDLIEIDFNVISDTVLTNVTSQTQRQQNFFRQDAYSDSGVLRCEKVSDTTFQIGFKTVVAGNISRIIGISL